MRGQATMAPLDSLPMEMLWQIFSSVPSTDLCALARSNRYCSTAAQSMLYTSIDLRLEKVKLRGEETRTDAPQIAPLLSTLLRRLDLAAQVGEFKDHLTQFIAYIDTMELPNNHEWIEALKQGSMDAVITLLVSRLPNLSLIHLASGAAEESRFLGEMFASALCGQPTGNLPTFPRLRSLTFIPISSGRGRRLSRNTKDVLAFLYLPGLEHLHTRIESPLCFSWPSDGVAPPACNLTSMKLTGIREGPLGHLLRATKYLETLEWESLYDPHANSTHDGTTSVYLNQFMTDLSHVKTTLRSLRISIDWRSDHFYMWPTLIIQGSLDGLRDFEQLTHLEVPMVFLVGIAHGSRPGDRLETGLPVGLESLIINDDGSRYNNYDWPDLCILPMVTSWLARWRTWTPLLRKSTWQIFNDDWASAEVRQLRDAHLSAGLAVEIQIEAWQGGRITLGEVIDLPPPLRDR
ncbi:hypothetical protein QBC34DRAFT_480019 [Podospora aff. communis PSN243]|uniref:F-box domain-containing protein n=1 Tax=Podospora aff. communis PSN243 TaxID=3040156 RepID=A0AAV9G5T4_9PEZI|nr:hypothetical protein QBC34DRAFT_480019 [Podospora aff. communis PSN243]